MHTEFLFFVQNADIDDFLLFSVGYLNSFSAKGNIELFANNTDSGEPARNELSHLKSALFGCEL